MFTNKENAIIKMGIFVFVLMVIGSLFVSFNIYGAVYVAFTFFIIIRHIIINRKK